jgi:hypothetical protein
MYRLRSKVTIKPLLTQRVAFVPAVTTVDNSMASSGAILSVRDPRTVDFGSRLLVTDGTLVSSVRMKDNR